MAQRRNYTVDSKPGLNVRAFPAKDARILRVLTDGEKVAVDNKAAAPEGWIALTGGGFVMAPYLK